MLRQKRGIRFAVRATAAAGEHASCEHKAETKERYPATHDEPTAGVIYIVVILLHDNVVHMDITNGQIQQQRLTAYTPVWKSDGKRFKAWLAIGNGGRFADGQMFGLIDCLPVDPDENFTGYLRFVVAGMPPPPPLSVTREEFLASVFRDET
jgi:hypothetical protein